MRCEIQGAPPAAGTLGCAQQAGCACGGPVTLTHHKLQVLRHTQQAHWAAPTRHAGCKRAACEAEHNHPCVRHSWVRLRSISQFPMTGGFTASLAADPRGQSPDLTARVPFTERAPDGTAWQKSRAAGAPRRMQSLSGGQASFSMTDFGRWPDI